MEKTKAEQYMERLQKWKEEKKKEKETKMKNNRRLVARPLKTVAVKPEVGMKNMKNCVKQSSVGKPVTKRLSGIKYSHGIPNRTVSKVQKNNHSEETRQIRISGIKKSQRIPNITDSKIQKKSKSEETREMQEKLKKWREETKNEKKNCPTSVIKAHGTPRPREKPHYKEVKSRLFDYQTKPISNKITGIKSTMNKENKHVHGITQLIHKRRHSEIPKSQPNSKPAGILKRKSCMGSIDRSEEEKKFSPKRQCTSTSSLTTTCSRKPQDELNQNVECEPENLERNHSKAMLPTLVVTPGMSTRNVRFSTPPNDHAGIMRHKLRKTPKTPATRSAELSDWLKSKGRTPSKFRHLMCFHAEKLAETSNDPLTKNALSVDELNEQMNVLEQERLQSETDAKMNSMLDECMVLFHAGCPMESIVPWLDDIYKQIPCSRTSARYYTCKAMVIKSSLDLDAVLEIFEQATINNAQPKEEIAKTLTETLKYVTEGKVQQAKQRCRTPRRSQVQVENVFESSTVLYAVSVATPFSEVKRSASKKVATAGQVQVVTPVRRSTRRSLQNLPGSLKDNKLSYSSLDEVKGKEDILFQPNLAMDTILSASYDE